MYLLNKADFLKLFAAGQGDNSIRAQMFTGSESEWEYFSEENWGESWWLVLHLHFFRIIGGREARYRKGLPRARNTRKETVRKNRYYRPFFEFSQEPRDI